MSHGAAHSERSAAARRATHRGAGTYIVVIERNARSAHPLRDAARLPPSRRRRMRAGSSPLAPVVARGGYLRGVFGGGGDGRRLLRDRTTSHHLCTTSCGEPDDDGTRYCIDLVCISGAAPMPVLGELSSSD